MGFKDFLVGATSALDPTRTNNKSVVQTDSAPLSDLGLNRVIGPILLNFWNSTDPYVFYIVKADDDGKVSSLELDSSVLDKLQMLNSNRFVLRIPPSSLSISTQYAISVTATNGGILEEHNGVVFRTITISGTTGVLPEKGSRHEKPPGGLLGLAANIFPATAASIGGAISKVTSVLSGGAETVPADGDQKDFILEKSGYSQFWQLYNFIAIYAQAQKDPSVDDELRLVFASQKDNMNYIVTPLLFELKRDISNPLLYRYNIVMRAWDAVNTASNEVLTPPDVPSPNNVSLVKTVLNTIKSARSTLQAARNVLSGVHSDIDSIFDIYNQSVLFLADAAGLISDVRTFGSTLVNNRQTLFLNSQRNQNTIAQALQNDRSATSSTRLLANTLKETTIPSNVPSQTAKTAILTAGGARGSSLRAKTPGEAIVAATNTGVSAQAATLAAETIARQAAKAAKRATRKAGSGGSAAAAAVADAAAKAAAAAAAAAMVLSSTVPPSVATTNPNASGPIANAAQAAAGAVSTAVAQAAFSSSKTTPGGEDKISGGKTATQTVSSQADSAIQKAFTLNSLLDLPVTAFDLPPSLKTQLNNQTETARGTNAGDIRELTDKLQEVSDNFAKSLGSLDPTYARVYGVPTTTSTTTVTKQANEDDILLAVALQEAKLSFTSMLATGEIFKEKEPDPFLSANQALPPSEQLQSPRGATVVPYERGASLERLAQRYLGSPARAREIAILNGLRAPYIDEAGFTQSIAAVTGRTFIVIGAERFAIGQVVTIQGTSLPSIRRRIVALDDVGAGRFQITVDGLANLSVYVPASNPSVKARLPGTIGSGDVFLLPSTTGPDDPVHTRPTPLFSRLTHAEKVFKIDVLLDETGHDLAISANGDVQRSFGYTNAVQAIRLALETEQGELERHLKYGLPIPIGSRSSDLDQEELKFIVQQRIQTDPRFQGAAVNIQQEDSVTRIFIVAEGALGTGTIPVNFEIGRQ